jgi:hypothetical protein
MGRIVDGVTGDPMRIDGGSVECHGEGPVIRGELGQLLAQGASLSIDAVQSRSDIDLSRLRSEALRWRLPKVGSRL